MTETLEQQIARLRELERQRKEAKDAYAQFCDGKQLGRSDLPGWCAKYCAMATADAMLRDHAPEMMVVIDAQAEALREKSEESARRLLQNEAMMEKINEQHAALVAKDEQLKAALEGLNIIATVSSAGALKYAVEHAAMRSQAKDTLAALAALETKQAEG